MPASAPIPLWPEGELPGRHDAPATEAEQRALAEVPSVQPFLLEQGGPRGLVIVCPGGGYGRLAVEHEGIDVARWLNSIGLHAAVLRYRVAPWRHPTPLADARQALRLVRKQAEVWQVLAHRVALLGFSAGGHLAASAACLPETDAAARPDALLLAYAVLGLGAERHEGSRRNLLGAARDPALEQALSLPQQVTAQVPPCFVWHTATDAAVPLRGALDWTAACTRHGVPVSLHVFPQGRHGLGLACAGERRQDEVAQWTTLAGRWFAGMGWI